MNKFWFYILFLPLFHNQLYAQKIFINQSEQILFQNKLFQSSIYEQDFGLLSKGGVYNRVTGFYNDMEYNTETYVNLKNNRLKFAYDAVYANKNNLMRGDFSYSHKDNFTSVPYVETEREIFYPYLVFQNDDINNKSYEDKYNLKGKYIYQDNNHNSFMLDAKYISHVKYSRTDPRNKTDLADFEAGISYFKNFGYLISGVTAAFQTTGELTQYEKIYDLQFANKIHLGSGVFSSFRHSSLPIFYNRLYGGKIVHETSFNINSKYNFYYNLNFGTGIDSLYLSRVSWENFAANHAFKKFIIEANLGAKLQTNNSTHSLEAGFEFENRYGAEIFLEEYFIEDHFTQIRITGSNENFFMNNITFNLKYKWLYQSPNCILTHKLNAYYNRHTEFLFYTDNNISSNGFSNLIIKYQLDWFKKLKGVSPRFSIEFSHQIPMETVRQIPFNEDSYKNYSQVLFYNNNEITTLGLQSGASILLPKNNILEFRSRLTLFKIKEMNIVTSSPSISVIYYF